MVIAIAPELAHTVPKQLETCQHNTNESQIFFSPHILKREYSFAKAFKNFDGKEEKKKCEVESFEQNLNLFLCLSLFKPDFDLCSKALHFPFSVHQCRIHFSMWFNLLQHWHCAAQLFSSI